MLIVQINHSCINNNLCAFASLSVFACNASAGAKEPQNKE